MLSELEVKAKKETTLFTILTGSHLYGNATATSDFDYKAVCLPSLDDLLLNVKVTNRKEKPEGVGQGERMAAGETETEYLPLQVFFNDFFDGQTYALEVAFAAKQNLIKFNDELPKGRVIQVKLIMNDLVDGFLTSNVKKMVGYAVSQSKLYGLKTQRYTSLGEALRTMNLWGREHVFTNEERATLALVDTPSLVDQLLKLEHVKRIEIMNAAGGTEAAPGIEICGKQYSLTNRIVTIVKSIEKSLGNYGERVKEFDGEGVDWKALSHAIRITEQVIELSNTGTIVFPRPNAEFLRKVKAGEVSLEEATNYLNSEFAKVDAAVERSVLQTRTPELELKFREWKINSLRLLYEV